MAQGARHDSGSIFRFLNFGVERLLLGMLRDERIAPGLTQLGPTSAIIALINRQDLTFAGELAIVAGVHDGSNGLKARLQAVGGSLGAQGWRRFRRSARQQLRRCGAQRRCLPFHRQRAECDALQLLPQRAGSRGSLGRLWRMASGRASNGWRSNRKLRCAVRSGHSVCDRAARDRGAPAQPITSVLRSAFSFSRARAPPCRHAPRLGTALSAPCGCPPRR